MKEKRKARREPGGGQVTAGKQLSTPQYSTITHKRQTIRALSNLLDQALVRAEFHSNLADFHHSQALKHRAILHSLQTLIPQKKFNTEGELTNG